MPSYRWRVSSSWLLLESSRKRGHRFMHSFGAYHTEGDGLRLSPIRPYFFTSVARDGGAKSSFADVLSDIVNGTIGVSDADDIVEKRLQPRQRSIGIVRNLFRLGPLHRQTSLDDQNRVRCAVRKVFWNF